jgi:hypothetical protein
VPITADDREKWTVATVATEAEQRTESRNHRKTSVAAHHDHLTAFCFPAPAFIGAGNKTRHNTATRSKASGVTRSSAARWMRTMTTVISD